MHECRKKNIRLMKIPKKENRTVELLREHYKIEKELASRLRNASRDERRYLYSALYNELFRRVPHHPQLTCKKESELQLVAVSRQMKLLKSFLNSESVFIEVGPGDCSLSIEVAKHARKVYAIDVSEEITKGETFPQNFELIISDGCSIPIPENTANIAYSKDLMEHLHPDDAIAQLQNIYKALTCGGKYICITPNRLSGPHDISKYFNNVATGFHLKEYTATELSKLFYKIGFSKISAYIGGKGIYMKFPLLPIKMCEKLLNVLPLSFRRRIAKLLPFEALLGIIIVGTK